MLNWVHGKLINIRTVRKLKTNLKPAYHHVIKHSKLKWFITLHMFSAITNINMIAFFLVD